MPSPELLEVTALFEIPQVRPLFGASRFEALYLRSTFQMAQEAAEQNSPEEGLHLLAGYGPYFMLRALKTYRLGTFPELGLAQIVDRCQEPQQAILEALTHALRYGVSGIQKSNIQAGSHWDILSRANNMLRLTHLLCYLLEADEPTEALNNFIDALPEDLAFHAPKTT